MHELRDPALLESYIRKYHIRSLFDTPELPFRLYEYAPGEMMHMLHKPEDYLKFVVDGAFRIYAIQADGSTQPILLHNGGFLLLGILEFCGFVSTNHYQEVLRPVRTVELPMEPLREVLMKDNRFLRHLLQVMAANASGIFSYAQAGDLETVLLRYLRSECPDHRITHVGNTAFYLHYSRRQIQRVLRDLTDRGILIREGKGIYRLAE